MGVSLLEIMERFGVSRRTAERMRDGVDALFGPLESTDDENRQRRWKLRRGTLDLPPLVATDLIHLKTAADMMAQQNRPDASRALLHVNEVLRAAHDRERLRRLETDLGALMDAEGLAMRPGPRVKVDPVLLDTFRHAVLSLNKLKLGYRSRSSGRDHDYSFHPYGLLYGSRPYIVGKIDTAGGPSLRVLRLSNVTTLELTETPFEIDPDFDLRVFAQESFGVFREKPFDVVWKFAPSAASDAREWEFHPSQKLQDQPDGSLIVSFRAGGALEMSWHLHTWGAAVTVIEPADFWDRVARQRVESIPAPVS